MTIERNPRFGEDLVHAVDGIQAVVSRRLFYKTVRRCPTNSATLAMERFGVEMLVVGRLEKEHRANDVLPAGDLPRTQRCH